MLHIRDRSKELAKIKTMPPGEGCHEIFQANNEIIGPMFRADQAAVYIPRILSTIPASLESLKHQTQIVFAQCVYIVV